MVGFQRALKVRSWGCGTFALAFVSLGLSGCVAPGVERPATASAIVTPAEPPARLTDLAPSQIRSLANLSAPELLSRLGPPDFTRLDPPAQLWQYRGATCVLDLFLYPDGNALRVAHAETRDRHGTESAGLTENPCSPFTPETTASTS